MSLREGAFVQASEHVQVLSLREGAFVQASEHLQVLSLREGGTSPDQRGPHKKKKTNSVALSPRANYTD
jgi:hypothetical protein